MQGNLMTGIGPGIIIITDTTAIIGTAEMRVQREGIKEAGDG